MSERGLLQSLSPSWSALPTEKAVPHSTFHPPSLGHRCQPLNPQGWVCKCGLCLEGCLLGQTRDSRDEPSHSGTWASLRSFISSQGGTCHPLSIWEGLGCALGKWNPGSHSSRGFKHKPWSPRMFLPTNDRSGPATSTEEVWQALLGNT